MHIKCIKRSPGCLRTVPVEAPELDCRTYVPVRHDHARLHAEDGIHGIQLDHIPSGFSQFPREACPHDWQSVRL